MAELPDSPTDLERARRAYFDAAGRHYTEMVKVSIKERIRYDERMSLVSEGPYRLMVQSGIDEFGRRLETAIANDEEFIRAVVRDEVRRMGLVPPLVAPGLLDTDDAKVHAHETE